QFRAPRHRDDGAAEPSVRRDVSAGDRPVRMLVRGIGGAPQDHGGRHALLSVGHAAPDQPCAPRLRGGAEPAGRSGVGRRHHSRLVPGADAMSGSFFVPHDLAAPLRGAQGGPPAGLTALVKDMYDIAGHRTGGGSPEWLAAQKPAARHAAAVERILAAGATITGKTICDEFFYSVAGINADYGTPTNLRAPGRIPGGSSSGSAAACGAGTCDFALGSDTGGSVRLPASFNGLYGLRPSHGRVDLTGAMAMAPSFDVAGWFASGPGVFRRVGAVLLGGE